MNQYRHGDLLIVQVDDIPEGSKPVKLDNGRRVLAYGEVTGHAHVLDHGLLFKRDGNLYFRAPQGASVTHEEHNRIDLPPGNYRVKRQVEYVPKAVPRQVAD